MNDEDAGESIAIAVLMSRIDRMVSDVHESGIRITELSKELSDLRAEVLKYKWIGYGIGAVCTFVFAILNYIGFDFFKKS